MAIPITTSPQFQKNIQKVRTGEQPCVYCGRGIDMKKDRVKFVYTRYGGELLTKEEYEAHAASGGRDAWEMPIGGNCLAAHPMFQKYLVK